MASATSEESDMGGRLTGKVAIVTGGGQGIGGAISSRFAAEGARVVVAQRSESVARARVEAIRSAGGQAFAVSADVAQREQLRALVARTVEAYGPPDILVNNAGIFVADDPLELSEDDWQRTMSVDLEGVWWLTREVLPHMLDRGGAVINIASTHSFLIVPGCFPYPVAKHALIGLTRALAAEYAARGVRINAIAPAYIETDMVSGYLAAKEDPSRERARVAGLHPLGRMGRPEEIAGPAVFLASDDASFISGEVLMVDGGITTIYNGHGSPFVPGVGPSA
jgi:NAD(P)-dependent dehydrogenase (short-subunit alcohol dehydrogenase family)